MNTSMTKRSSRRIVVTAAAAVTISLGLAGCSSGTPSSETSGAGQHGDVLTVGSLISNGSLDPAKANPGLDPVYLDALYAPLIRFAPDGTLKGVLAKSWGFESGSQTAFDIKLRSGIKFSDGTPVNAAAVVGSIKHFAAGTYGGQWLSNCKSISAVSDSQVRIGCTVPTPDLASIFTNGLLGGDIVAPASLANPKSLATDPIGAGQYVFDPGSSVLGSSYTFTANKKYFDKSAIHWNTVKISTYGNPSAGLSAVKSGQLDQYFDLDPSSLQSATSAGINTTVGAASFTGVLLANRNSGPLANLQVRQALEYAVDRPSIVKALYGPLGEASDQVAIPTQPSAWAPSVNSYYAYDVSKAKQLLAQAGYPNGFTLKVETQASLSPLTQAVLGYWSKVGVKATLATDATTTGWITNVLSRKFDAMGYQYGGLPMSLEATNWFQPIPNLFNPFATNDATMSSILKSALAAPQGEAQAAFQQLQVQGVKDAWYVGVGVVKGGQINAKAIKALPQHGLYAGNVVDIVPAS